MEYFRNNNQRHNFVDFLKSKARVYFYGLILYGSYTNDRDELLEDVKNAIDKVEDYQDKPSDHPDVETVIENNFHSHSPSVVRRILDRLKAMATELPSMNGNTRRRWSTCKRQTRRLSIGRPGCTRVLPAESDS